MLIRGATSSFGLAALSGVEAEGKGDGDDSESRSFQEA